MGHVVVEEKDRMLDSQGPKFSIGNVSPVDGGVKEHGASDGHHSLDRAFSNTIVMVGTDSGETRYLSELFEVSTIILGSERAAIITQIFFGNDSIIPTVVLEGFFGFDGFMRSQMDLMGDEDVSGSMINEDGASRILLFFLFFPVSGWKAATCGADKVID